MQMLLHGRSAVRVGAHNGKAVLVGSASSAPFGFGS
jgi:hypothetical protein